MAGTLATFTALIFSLYNVDIFGYNLSTVCTFRGVFYPSLFIKLGLFFLLLNVNVYRKCFRRINEFILYFYEVSVLNI